jgi:hypothetical protein
MPLGILISSGDDANNGKSSSADIPATQQERAPAMFVTDHTKLQTVSFWPRQTQNVHIKFHQNLSSDLQTEACDRGGGGWRNRQKHGAKSPDCCIPFMRTEEGSQNVGRMH